jgi:hypothetical protein
MMFAKMQKGFLYFAEIKEVVQTAENREYHEISFYSAYSARKIRSKRKKAPARCHAGRRTIFLRVRHT